MPAMKTGTWTIRYTSPDGRTWLQVELTAEVVPYGDGYGHQCADDCTPGTCEVQHDLEFNGPELRAAEKFAQSDLWQ